MTRFQKWWDSPQGYRGMLTIIACLAVMGISSIGQINAENRAPRTNANFAAADVTESTVGNSDSTLATTTTTDPIATATSGLSNTPGTSTTHVRKGPVPDYGLKTQGVTDKEVKIGLTYNVSGCGDSGALSASLGEAVTGDPQTAFATYVRYINDGGGINGRKFILDIADDGSGGCPEKARAAAVKLVDQDKVFAVIPGINEVSDYTIEKKIPTMNGREDEASLKAFGPNGLGLVGIQSALEAWSSFAKYYLNSGANTPCLVHPDEVMWNKYEQTLVKLMAARGLSFKTILRYQEDVASAQVQAGAGVTKLRNAGCNQIFFMAYNPIALIFFTSAASEGLFFPDVWTFTSYTALIDTELAGRLLNQKQWSKAVGLSYRVPTGHPANGNCKRIYVKYNPEANDADSAAVQLACALLLPVAEIMRRAENITGELTANSYMVGADSITNDYYFDAIVPMDYKLPAGGPYGTKAFSDWTVAKWNAELNKYDFPNFPKYWKTFGPGLAGGADIRPLLKAAPK